MPRNFARYFYVLLMVSSSLVVFAQHDGINSKLAPLKANDDLSNWIYERLDYVNDRPELRLAFLMDSQKEAWRTAKSPDEHFAWLNLLSTQGYYQLLTGNILSSIQQYENAFSFYLKHKVNSYNIVAYTLKPLSNNYTRLGDYERALYLQKLSIKYQTQFDKNPNEIAAIFCNMAISYRSMDKLTEAKSTIEKGFALKPNKATLTMLNNIYADILYDQENYSEALNIISKNIKQQATINVETAYWLMSAYTTAGNIYTVQNQLSTAKNSYEKALSILEKYYPYGRTREKANLFTQLGKVALWQREPKIAIQYFEQTLHTLGISDHKNNVIVKNIYGDNKLVDVFLQLANAHLQLDNGAQALTDINLSLLSADKIRKEFGDDKTKERLQSDLKKIVEQGIDISYDLFQKSKNPKYLHQILLLTEQSKSRTLLDQMERNASLLSKNQKNDTLFIKKQTLERNIIYQEKQEIQTKKISETIAGLKFDLALVNKAIAKKYKQLNYTNLEEKVNLSKLPKHRLITYFFGEENIYVININKQIIENVLKLENAAEIKKGIKSFVETYFQQGANAMLNSPKSFYLASYKVYQSIFEPLKLQPNETITLIPDGILGYVSFDGLITNPNYHEAVSQWPFLIKQYQSTYAFSLKTLQFNQPKVKKNEFTGMLITHESTNKTPLKAMEEEANAIQQIIRGTFLFNEEVNVKSFEKQFSESKILHIGTHAYLSGTNQEPTLDFGNEKIYLFELAAKQSAPSLVVLSACRTADGLLADGEGIISFSRGFNAVGTVATVASLWNANDNTVATISASFYKSLSEGKNGSEALRLAKIAWLDSSPPSNAMLLPYYWDSLVYMGKDQNFELEKPFPLKQIWIAFFLAGGLFVSILITRKLLKIRNSR